ncbi:DUF4267 domain-containing protein [Pedobacter gandavensis]|uniref:DUF4267 domain-containing protein n=1 Tax=Pedobacter gandavensis TaxID=2679963 RepID=A0ABR6F1I2_9SPHI|nr:DUF4267 domain-containing protein [Pedobacter gandavensis]MBB2151374.1 DUF4267 domain-containing protein [Pedobacter gandavensis]
MKSILKQTAFYCCLLSGLGLLFIGLRFFFDPIAASTDYGIKPQLNMDFSFEYIKGIRDFFFGLIILVLLLKKQWQALGWVLLTGVIIPLADFSIVISQPEYVIGHTIAHLIAIVICFACGIYYLKNHKTISQ